jgi:hypothetical protein
MEPSISVAVTAKIQRRVEANIRFILFEMLRDVGLIRLSSNYTDFYRHIQP